MSEIGKAEPRVDSKAASDELKARVKVAEDAVKKQHAERAKARAEEALLDKELAQAEKAEKIAKLKASKAPKK